MQNKNRGIVIWLYTGCLLIFLMVVIGGITRLTGSGLSITEWKLVTGTLPPLTDAAWEKEFAAYQQIPQFKEVNSHFGLHDFKEIYWWEYIHRLIGRVLGIVFIIPFLFFYYTGQISNSLRNKLLVIFLLGAWQGFLGWYMVSSGLANNPYVSHYRLAIHLINAFLTVGYMFWVILDLRADKKENAVVNKQAVRYTLIALTLVVFQIIFGAFVAGLHAGNILNTWPKMGGEWISEMVYTEYGKFGLSSFFNQLASVQFVHRTLAMIILVFMLFLWFKSRSWSLNVKQIRAIHITLILLLVQVLLGIFTLLYQVPISLGVIHQACAFLLFLALIHQAHFIVKRGS